MEALAPACALVDHVHGLLSQSPHIAPRDLQVIADEGAVRLHGTVGSFFQKQMAQELLRRVDGVERIENLLQVNW
ncbi:MAG: transport-associated protein [Planctomycetaceae bacterium]|nr:transport-associated protein [Planctomycetaceae bacterium]